MALPTSYQHLETVQSPDGPLDLWLSAELRDDLWDDFLQSTPLGQFQQSSLWAEYKAAEGWRAHRVVLSQGEDIAGGFQLLWKSRRGVRLGYVSKGPVMANPSSTLMGQLRRRLEHSAHQLRLLSVVLQYPDDCPEASWPGSPGTWLRSNPLGVIEATYLLDLDVSAEELVGQMSPSMRRNIRKAKQKPQVVERGRECDIPQFFALMSQTCERQGVRPNPPNPEATLAFWNVFARRGLVRMTFLRAEDRVISTQLTIAFGAKFTLWKKGWDGSHGQWHPNELLEGETLEWARSNGFRTADFCSLQVPTARALLAGQEPDKNRLSSRDEYHLRFGGRPQLLPPALVLIPNPLLRWLYRLLYLPLERRKRRRAGL